MPRTSLAAVVLFSAAAAIACSCKKSPEASSPEPTKRTGDLSPAGSPPDMKAGPPPGGAAGGSDEALKLKPEEGKLTIEVPPGATAGAEVVARVIVTPTDAWKINKEFPTKLKLTTPEGVTLAKPELKAGGPDQSKGDADAFEDKQLAFSVKLTPGRSGDHTVSGEFKFAVCDKATCIPKREQISIAVAAK